MSAGTGVTETIEELSWVRDLPIDPLLLWYAVFAAAALTLVLTIAMMLRQGRPEPRDELDELREVESSGVQFPGQLVQEKAVASDEASEDVEPDQQHVA